MNKRLDRQVNDANTVMTDRPKLGIRTGSSRKLLVRKMVEKAGEEMGEGEPLEASFPSQADDGPAAASRDAASIGSGADDQPHGEEAAMLAADAVGPTDAPATTTDAAPALVTLPTPKGSSAAQAWSAEDESGFQALLGRRKAADYQRRGLDVGGQVITVGTIRPNPGTVVAVIIGLVIERGGSIGRAELVDAMATADFPHAKAQPSDRGWCQGYVAGAIRNGFLTLKEQAAVTAQAA